MAKRHSRRQCIAIRKRKLNRLTKDSIRMPTWKSSRLPPPTSWDEFEAMIADIAGTQWRAPFVNRHGRQGQPQDGVDIYCKPYEFDGDIFGIQCKNTEEVTLPQIKGEIQKAENFEPELDTYVIATTAPNDQSIQEKIRDISHERESNNKFSVRIWMWHDITRALSENQDLLREYYPQLIEQKHEIAESGIINEQSEGFQNKTGPTICDLSISSPTFRPGETMEIEAETIGENHIDRIYCRFEHEDGGGAVFDAYNDFESQSDDRHYKIKYVWPENAPSGEYEPTWIYARDAIGNKTNLTDEFHEGLKIEIHSEYSDTQGPVIHNFSISDNRFKPGDTMKLDVNISDNTGIERLYFRFEHEDRGGAVFDAYRDFDPLAGNGSHVIEYEWPENTPVGLYEATWIFAKDPIGNTSTWTDSFSENEKQVNIVPR